MIVHFICRGNALRSLIAEAYLKSLELDDVTVISSGTVAKQYKDSNKQNYRKTLALLDHHGLLKFAKKHYADPLNKEQAAHADVTVCMNQLVFDEATRQCQLPANTIVWDVTDIGETGRIARSDAERAKFSEDAFNQITRNVDSLVQSLGLVQKAYQGSPL
jgi:protein-tyrosine-phosphatase